MHGNFRKIFYVEFTFYKILEKCQSHFTCTTVRLRHGSFFRVLDAFCKKNCPLSMQDTKTSQVSVITFCKSSFFKKIYWKFVLAVLQNFPYSVEIFPWMFFVTTCNQKLGYGLNLSISRIFYHDFQKLSSRPFFYYYVEKLGLLQEFLTKFSWVHWNIDEKKINWVVQA